MKLTLALFLILFFGEEQKKTMKKLSVKNINIEYPETWEKQENHRTVFLLMRPIEKKGQTFRENINLIIMEDHGLELKEYTALSKVQLKSQLSGYNELSTEYIKLGGKKYCRLIYQHNTNNFPLQVAYYIYLHNGKSYNLTCTSTMLNFDKYFPLFEKIISSFEVEE